jgi:superkiller protein 3
LPVLQIVPVGENIVAERYAYVSTAGLILLAGYAFAEWNARKGIIALVVAGIASVALIWVTRDRIPDWKDNLSLFKDVAEKYPDSPVAHNNTGYGYEQLREYRKALHHYFIASTLRKNYADVLYNIGSVYGEDLLMPDSGIYYLRKALAANPKKTEAYNNMATFFYQKDVMDSSIYYYKKVLEARPDYSLGLYNIGCAYYKIAAYDKALESYQRAVELDPKFAESWLSLGNTWAMLKDTDKQIQAYKTAAQYGSENAKNYLRQNNITW